MGFGSCSSRTMLGVLGLLFLASTIAMWGLGGYVLSTFKNIQNLASSTYTLVPATIMILVGIIFLLAAISACCAATRESRACSFTLFMFTFLLCVMLIASAILAFVYKKQIETSVRRETNETFYKYGDKDQDSITKQIDYLQTQMHCCGLYNFTSWDDTPWGRGHMEEGHWYVPLSCCISKNPTNCKNGSLDAMSPDFNKYIFTDGCLYKVESFLSKNLRYIGGGAIGLLLLLILGMVAACVIVCKKDENPYFNLG